MLHKGGIYRDQNIEIFSNASWGYFAICFRRYTDKRRRSAGIDY